MRLSPIPLIAVVLTASTALAQNDECTGAIALVDSVPTPFDTSAATLSPEVWNCAANGGPDLWYSFVPSQSNVSVRFSTCGASYDTALEVYDGTCAALNLIQCLDDSCGLQQEIVVPNVTMGQTYFVRVGGFNGSVGFGDLTATEGMPPVQGCTVNPGFETGDITGWDFIDNSAPFLAGQAVAAGFDVGFGFFTADPTEGSFSFVTGWDGNANETTILAQDLTVSSGLTPLTFDYRAGWDMVTFGGSTLDRTFSVVVSDATTGAPLQSTLLLTAAAATQNFDTGTMTASVDLSGFLGQTVTVSLEWFVPETLTGPAFFEVDNFSCPSGGGGTIGVATCAPSVPNSTGNPTVLVASGSTAVASNSVTLTASDLPINTFGFFIVSTMEGFVPNPGGSAGNLCLAGSIGRYVGPGQIQNSGQSGSFMLALDLTMIPQPAGFVAAASGDTWNFQAWHRDAMGGMATSNFSNGVEIVFN